MTIAPRYPSLYQLNTRVWLRRLSRERGKRTTLAEIDDATIDGFALQGFDWVWLLSVWRTGPAGRAISSEQTRVASRVRSCPARSRRGRHMRLRLRYHRLHGQRRDRG
jgi:hypothetical protein